MPLIPWLLRLPYKFIKYTYVTMSYFSHCPTKGHTSCQGGQTFCINGGFQKIIAAGCQYLKKNGYKWSISSSITPIWQKVPWTERLFHNWTVVPTIITWLSLSITEQSRGVQGAAVGRKWKKPIRSMVRALARRILEKESACTFCC